MAILDASANEIVIRVVYDGAPESGKTTSLRALAGSLAQATVTPEEDPTGRTLWFDWMEYTGGRFEGARIRCQIVSVPGQRELEARRRALLATADVVVAVIDTTPVAFAHSVAYLQELRDAVAGTTVGVVLQANKRDRPDALPLAEVRTALDAPAVGTIESVAAEGTGIREAFVYAVRLALDRVRELMSRSALATGELTQRSAEDLLAALRGAEAPRTASPTIATAAESVAAAALREVLDAEEEAAVRRVEPIPGHAPHPPDAGVPSGAIWPPVEGRAILAEVSEHDLVPRRFGDGDWFAGLGSGWRVVSRRDACYATLDEGRAALVQWARLHAATAAVISPHRCVVLAAAGDGSWRLWQIVRVEGSLREAMASALEASISEETVVQLRESGKQLLDAVARVASSPCDLECTFDTIGMSNGIAVYIGLMPGGGTAQPRTFVVPTTLLRAELEPVAAAARIGERGAALQQVIDAVARPSVDRDGIMSTIVALFG